MLIEVSFELNQAAVKINNMGYPDEKIMSFKHAFRCISNHTIFDGWWPLKIVQLRKKKNMRQGKRNWKRGVYISACFILNIFG